MQKHRVPHFCSVNSSSRAPTIVEIFLCSFNRLLQHPSLQVGAPGQHVAAGDSAELFRLLDAREAHKGADVVLVGAPGLHAGEAGKPLRLERHAIALLK